MQLDDVPIMGHIVTFDDRCVVDGFAPDPGEFEAMDVVLVDLSGHIQKRAAASDGKGPIHIGLFG